MFDILIVEPKVGDIVRVYQGSRDHWVIGEVFMFNKESRRITITLPSHLTKVFEFERFDSIEVLSKTDDVFRVMSDLLGKCISQLQHRVTQKVTDEFINFLR